MKTLDALLQKLWKDYSSMNKQAEIIHAALEKKGEKVVNDHIAFRTFDHPKVNIEVLAASFLKLGYHCAADHYRFPEKKLIAKHYEHKDPQRPKIFISALLISQCSAFVQKTLGGLIEQIPEDLPRQEDFLVSGAPWKKISWETYQGLLKENEYAAWMAAFGFRVNHFTVSYNSLKTFKGLADLNQFIHTVGFDLNASGGEVKGNPQVYLEQSSTLAYPVKVSFSDKIETIPGCYYEFARRYVMPDGKIFQGFLPDSADKIFESTHYRIAKPQ